MKKVQWKRLTQILSWCIKSLSTNIFARKGSVKVCQSGYKSAEILIVSWYPPIFRQVSNHYLDSNICNIFGLLYSIWETTIENWYLGCCTVYSNDQSIKQFLVTLAITWSNCNIVYQFDLVSLVQCKHCKETTTIST